MIDYTITIGNLMSLVAIVMGGITFLIRVESRLNILIHERIMEKESTGKKFEDIDTHLTKLGDALIQLAKQEVRMDGIEKRISELLQKIEEINEGGTRFSPQRSKKRSTI